MELKRKLSWHGSLTKSILGHIYAERSRDGFEMVFLEVLMDLLKDDSVRLSPSCESFREIITPREHLVKGVSAIVQPKVRDFMSNCLNITLASEDWTLKSSRKP